MIEKENILCTHIWEKFKNVFEEYYIQDKLTPRKISEIVDVTSQVIKVEDSDIFTEGDIELFCESILEPLLFEHHKSPHKITTLNLCDL